MDGKQFGQFTIIRKIGAGGMGEVYLAQDAKLSRQVALKFLPPDFFSDEERKSRFQREARTAAQISHANITGIFDIVDYIDESSGAHAQYIVMEFVDGRSLKDYLADVKPDMRDILRLAEKIASGLAAAHKLNIVHRDIKADNILINAEGEPKILDFGLAKSVEQSATKQTQENPEGDTISRELTEVGKIVGTVTYMSPEQARGENLDTRSDVFSFGVLMYRMVTGEFPFTGPTQVSTIAKILETQHTPPSSRNANIPPELERIINKCLHKQASDRYQDTRDLVVDLRELRRRYDSGISDSISAVSGVTSTPEIKKRNKSIVLGSAAIGFVLLFAAIFKFFGGDSSEAVQLDPNCVAIMNFESNTDDAELAWLGSGLPDILVTDLTENQSLRVLSRQRLIDYLHKETGQPGDAFSNEQFRMAAKNLGAASILSGNFFKFGDKVSIVARLEDMNAGEVRWSSKVIGADIFALIDSLSTKVSTSLNVADLSPTDQSVASITTFSPKAYKLYLEGLEKFKLSLQEEAREKFEAALEIDSTFALPYMRLGMSHIFDGHQRTGKEYLAKAITYQDKLSVKERSLLNCYADIWLTDDINSGFNKLQSYVNNYPDDKEARTIYAISKNLAGDTTAAFQLFEDVLAQDPGDPLALTVYADVLSQNEQTDRAIGLMHRLERFHPESPDPYMALTAYYDDVGETEKAIQYAHITLDKFPDHANPLRQLYQLYVKKRNFDSAEHYLKLYSQDDTTDQYKWTQYYRSMGSLATWRGQFREATRHYEKSLESSKKTGDGVYVYNSYLVLSSHHYRIGEGEAAATVMKNASMTGLNTFQAIVYPLATIAMDFEHGKALQPLFDSLATAMRSQLPQGMWSIVDGMVDIYYGKLQDDTARMYKGYETLNSDPKFRNSANIRNYGHILVENGSYQKAVEVLSELLTDRREQSGGWDVPSMYYDLGRAHEGVGNNRKAIEYYQEMLTYWGKPDKEIKEINDAKKRLARLTS